MATIKKNGKKFVAEIRRKGRYQSKTFETKAAAQQWALDKEQEMGARPAGTVAHSMREAMQKYAREVSPTRKGARWEIVRLKKLQRDPLANITLTDITHDDIDAWIQRQSISAGSVLRELTLIGAVLRQARVRWKWMVENPMPDVTRPKQPQPRERVINDDELKRLMLALEYDETRPIKTIRQEIAVAFLLAIETAMRQGELWALDWQFVYLNRKYVTLPETKNGTSRDVSLSPRAIVLLKKLTPANAGSVFKSNQASAATIFRRAVELAEIKNLTFHDSRHTAITRLARKLDVLDLARMVGHKDIRNLMIYYNPTAEDLAKRLAA